MSKTIELNTHPPVSVKVWARGEKHFWRYDYDGCPKFGPFNNYQQCLADARTYSQQ
jgi:hypothetical protein